MAGHRWLSWFALALILNAVCIPLFEVVILAQSGPTLSSNPGPPKV